MDELLFDSLAANMRFALGHMAMPSPDLEHDARLSSETQVYGCLQMVSQGMRIDLNYCQYKHFYPSPDRYVDFARVLGPDPDFSDKRLDFAKLPTFIEPCSS